MVPTVKSFSIDTAKLGQYLRPPSLGKPFQLFSTLFVRHRYGKILLAKCFGPT